jgi:SAM-dependent methyltransferase
MALDHARILQSVASAVDAGRDARSATTSWGERPRRSHRRRREFPMNYRLAYGLGLHPWEDAAAHPPFVQTLSGLLERVEAGRSPPYGSALDVGTGSGIWGVVLARRGWQVTGVDLVGKALQRAQRRVAEANVAVRLVQADVTAMRAAGVGTGFRLVLDTGTFHGLDAAQRERMGREVTAVAAPDATVLLLVWPRRRRPLIRGADRGDVEAAFPGWHVTDVAPSHFRLPTILDAVMKPDEQWYRLRRAHQTTR